MQMIQKIIHLDVFRFSFGEELDNYKYYFLIIVHKLPRDDHINPIKISLKIHNAGIKVKKDNFDY